MLRTVRDFRVIHQDVPGTDRTRYRYLRPGFPARLWMPPAWITLPRASVERLLQLGLIETGPRVHGEDEFSTWTERVRVTDQGERILAEPENARKGET